MYRFTIPEEELRRLRKLIEDMKKNDKPKETLKLKETENDEIRYRF
jgi:hypothetical protein